MLHYRPFVTFSIYTLFMVLELTFHFLFLTIIPFTITATTQKLIRSNQILQRALLVS